MAVGNGEDWGQRMNSKHYWESEAFNQKENDNHSMSMPWLVHSSACFLQCSFAFV